MAREAMPRRAPRTNAAPMPAVGDVARRRREKPTFNMDVGSPPELQDPTDQFSGNGVDLNDLVDLNPGSFAQEPTITGSNSDPFYRNLLGSDIPMALASRICVHLDEQFERDKQARENADKIVARGIEETGYDRQNDVRTSPFPGASAVVHPLFAQAATDFSSRTIKQLFPSKGPIKTEIQGQQSEDDLKRADKVRRFLNWLLTIRCRGYRNETDKMLTMLPFVGDLCKKLYWDNTEAGFGRPKPEFVMPEKFIIPYAATELEETPRYAHDLDIWPDRVDELMDSKVWLKADLKPSALARRSEQKIKADRVVGQDNTPYPSDDTMVFREAHVDWYFETLKPENDKFRQEALTKPAAPAAAPAAPGGPAPAPDPPGQSPDGLDMVDLGSLDGAGAPAALAPVTDPDAVKAGEIQPEPGGDDQTRVGASNGFPAGPKLSYVITYHQDTKTPVAIYRNWKKTDANQKKRVWFSHYVMFPWRSWNGLGLWHLIGGLAKSATGVLRALLDSAVIDNMPGGVRLANSRMSGDDISYRPMEFAKIQAPGITDIKNVMMAYPKNPTSPVLFELLKVIVQWGQSFATTATQEIMDMAPNTPATTVLQVIEHAGAIYSAIHARLHAAQEREFELLAELTAENLPDEGFAFSDQQGEEKITREDFARVKISPVSDPDTFSEMQRSVRGQAMLDLAKAAKEQGVNVDVRYAFTFYAQTLGLPDIDKLFPEQAKAVPRDPVSELFALMNGQPTDAFPGQNHKAHVAFMKMAAANPTYQQTIASVAPAFLALGHSHTMFMLRDELEQRAGGQLNLNDATLPPDQQFQIAQQCAELMAQLTQDVLANGQDPLLAMAQQMQQGGAGAAGAPGTPGAQGAGKSPQELQLLKDKMELERDKMIATDQQKDNDNIRKLTEKQGEIEAERQLAIFQDEMEDKRNRRELAAKLIIHFTTLQQEQNLSVQQQAHEIRMAVTDMIDGVFSDMNDKAHATAEAERGRQHDLHKAVVTKTADLADHDAQREHESGEKDKDREHQGDMADAAAETAAKAAAAAPESEAKEG